MNIDKKRTGHPKTDVWEYFEEKGERVKDHCGRICKFCSWEQQIAQPNDMRAHLALYYEKASYKTKSYYLDIIKANTIKTKKQMIDHN